MTLHVPADPDHIAPVDERSTVPGRSPMLFDLTPAPAPPPPPRFSNGPPPPPPPSPQPRRGRRLVLPAVTIVLSLAAGWAGGVLGGDESAEAPTAVAASPASVLLDSDTLDVAGVLAAVEPSVVSIETMVQVRQGPFGREAHGAGTGVVIDDLGHILTNAHVVEDASSITVTVNGDARQATLVGSDASADIAVLKVDVAGDLSAAERADADGTAVGDEVVAIGNALALEGGLTVTQGIISALDRSIDTTSGTLHGLIQTDAAISSGNFGGPLVNSAGQVIGINTAVASSSSGVEASNIGFAISIEDAIAVADEIIGTI